MLSPRDGTSYVSTSRKASSLAKDVNHSSPSLSSVAAERTSQQQQQQDGDGKSTARGGARRLRFPLADGGAFKGWLVIWLKVKVTRLE